MQTYIYIKISVTYVTKPMNGTLNYQRNNYKDSQNCSNGPSWS